MAMLEVLAKFLPVIKYGKGKTTTYQARLNDYWYETGRTKEEALAELLEKIRQALEPDYKPVIIPFRGYYSVVYRHPLYGWLYTPPREDNEPPTRSRVGNYKSKEDAERAARDHLAIVGWNGEDLTSQIILNEEDQTQFTETVTSEIKRRKLVAEGKTDAEIERAMGNPAFQEG